MTLSAIARSSVAEFGLGIGRGGSLAGMSTIVALGSLIEAAAVFTLSLPMHPDR
jgi:hypothetical protein